MIHSFGLQTILSPEIQEAPSPQPSIQEENLEPPKKRASLSPAEILEQKEAEVARLQDEVGEGMVLDAKAQDVPTFPIFTTVQPTPQ